MVVQFACVDEILGAQVTWFRWFCHWFLESYIAENTLSELRSWACVSSLSLQLVIFRFCATWH